MSTGLSHLVASGFVNAVTYDNHRPSYPAYSVDIMLDKLNVLDVANARILEIGAGTGKLTEQLVAYEKSYEIIAVEPHLHMRQVLLGKALSGVTVFNGTAADLGGVEEAWADGVVVAQAFHWFSGIEALQEIHRVIKPYGTLALIWNFEDYNSGVEWEATTVWENDMKKLLWAHDNHRKWQAIFQDQPNPPLYSPIEGDISEWTIWLTKEAIWDRFRTISRIASQTGDDFENTKKIVFEAMSGQDVEMNNKGEIALHGRTELFWTTALPRMFKGSL